MLPSPHSHRENRVQDLSVLLKPGGVIIEELNILAVAVFEGLVLGVYCLGKLVEVEVEDDGEKSLDDDNGDGWEEGGVENETGEESEKDGLKRHRGSLLNIGG